MFKVFELKSGSFENKITDWCIAHGVSYNKERIASYKDMLSLQVLDPEQAENSIAFAIAKDLENNTKICYHDFKLQYNETYNRYELYGTGTIDGYKSDSDTWAGSDLLNLIWFNDEFCKVVNFEAEILRVLFFKTDLERLINSAIEDREAADKKAAECHLKQDECKRQIEKLTLEINQLEFNRSSFNNRAMQALANSKSYSWLKEKSGC